MQEKESIMIVLWEIENSITRVNCSASLGKPREAEQFTLVVSSTLPLTHYIITHSDIV